MTPVGARLAAAGKALVGVFSDRAAREAHGLLAGLYPGAAGPAPTPGARERVAAFADAPWLHGVADKIASAFAAVEWELSVVRRVAPDGARRAVREKALQRGRRAERRKLARRLRAAGELDPLEAHPMLDLLSEGNSFMSGLEMRRLLFLMRYVEGEAFAVKERNGLAVPVGLYPIPPSWVAWTPTPSRRTFRFSQRGWQTEVPDTEVLWLAKRNPADPYGRGTGYARAVADEIETDEYAARLQRQVFFSGNRPDFIVHPVKGESWSSAETRRLEEEWRGQHEGFWRAFRARFSPREVGVFEFANTKFRDLQMEALRKFARDVHLQVAGMPPELLAVIENSNRATIEAAELLFAHWVLVPELESFRADLQERLVPEYDERLVLDYKVEDVEDREFVRAMAAVAPWSRRVDEWRDAQGLDPIGAENGGDLFPVSGSVTFEEAPEEPEDVPLPLDPAAPGAAPRPPAAEDDDEEEEDEDDPAARRVYRRLRRAARGRR